MRFFFKRCNHVRTYYYGRSTIQRTVTRIAHEILEYNKGTEQLVLLGIKTRGEFLARRIQEKLNKLNIM